MHPDFAPATVIWLKGGSVRSSFPLLPRIGFDGYRSHFIHTNHSRPRAGGEIGRDDAPLFSTNSGSCFSASWNQLCWRFHASPSAASHSQMVESDRWLWCRSKVHNSNGYPKLFGFWVAKLIKALRTWGA